MSANEKPLAPDQRLLSIAERRQLHERFEAGQGALRQGRATEAAESLVVCVAEDPGNLLYVAHFLECLKHPIDAAGLGQRLTLMRQEWSFRKAVAGKDHAAVLRLAPPLLIHRPDDSFLLGQLALACSEFRFREAELAWLRWATACRPDDARLLEQAATSLARKGRFDESLEVWTRRQQWKPADSRVGEAIELLRTNVGEQPTDLASANCDQLHALRRAIGERPADVAGYLALAEQLQQLGRLDEAEQIVQQAVAVSPGDPAANERLEQLRLDQIRRQLNLAERWAEFDLHPEVRELIDGLTTELHRCELELADHRSQRHPENRQLQWEAAQLLRRAGNFRETLRRIEAFPPDLADSPAALLLKAECLQGVRQFPAALEIYRSAEAAARDANDTPTADKANQRAAALAAALTASAPPDDSSRKFD
ncbi:MAG: tetratricopeptide repeat protein [Planctomycetales bacterium]|nr:tetratricopeptide repeat protein [Planctomycetales bacterium]